MRHYSELAHQTVNTTCVIPKSNTDTFCLKSLHTGKSESLLAALSSQAPFDFIKSVGLQPFSNLSGGIQPRSDLGSCSAAREYFTEWSWTHSLSYWKLSLPQSEVQSALELAIIIVSVDASFLDPDCLPVSVAKVYPHTVMLPPPGSIVGMAPSRQCPFSSRHDLWDSGQDFRLCLIRELCSWSESLSGGFGPTPDRLSCAFHPGVSLLRPFCPDQSAWPGSQL